MMARRSTVSDRWLSSNRADFPDRSAPMPMPAFQGQMPFQGYQPAYNYSMYAQPAYSTMPTSMPPPVLHQDPTR